MRITSGMMNEANMQAGTPLTGSTLASYLNGDSTRTLASSLGEKHRVSDFISKGKYEKLKEAAEKLEQYAEKLNRTGSGSVFEKARESGDTSPVYEEVEKLVSGYNDMLEKLRGDTSTMGRFYQASLREAAEENKEALKTVGISVDKSGKLSVDKEKLNSADINKVESIFGPAGTLSSKLYLIAGKVADSAQANVKSASSQYNAAGNSVDALIRSYDAKR